MSHNNCCYCCDSRANYNANSTAAIQILLHPTGQRNMGHLELPKLYAGFYRAHACDKWPRCHEGLRGYVEVSIHIDSTVSNRLSLGYASFNRKNNKRHLVCLSRVNSPTILYWIFLAGRTHSHIWLEPMTRNLEFHALPTKLTEKRRKSEDDNEKRKPKHSSGKYIIFYLFILQRILSVPLILSPPETKRSQRTRKSPTKTWWRTRLYWVSSLRRIEDIKTTALEHQ